MKSLTKVLVSKGIFVVSAMSLKEAEDAIENNDHFSHMICDYHLGGDNGLHALKAFNDSFPNAAMAIFTGDENFEHQKEVRDFLFDNDIFNKLGVLYKPIDQEVIFKWIKEAKI